MRVSIILFALLAIGGTPPVSRGIGLTFAIQLEQSLSIEPMGDIYEVRWSAAPDLIERIAYFPLGEDLDVTLAGNMRAAFRDEPIALAAAE